MDPNNQAPAPEAPAADVELSEEDEWAAASADFAQDKGIKAEEVKENPGDTDKPAATGPDGDAKPGDDPNKAAKPADAPAADDAKKDTPAAPADQSDPTLRDQRTIQRELAEDQKSTREDIRKEMFGDVKTQLEDADGDPINTIQDVQKLQNPNTGKPFTYEEAALYLLQAQNHLTKTIQDAEAQIEQIADVNLSLKDEADNVSSKYGAMLKAMPRLQKQLWSEYEKTLIKDEKSGIITKAPVSLERFYDVSLAGYIKLAEQMQATADAQEQAGKQVAQAQSTVQRVQTRSDRADIFGGGKTDTTDPEEAEWAKVAKQHYEG